MDSQSTTQPEFAEVLTDLLDKHHETPLSLAQKLGVAGSKGNDASYINAWQRTIDRGTYRLPPGHFLGRITETLGLSPEESKRLELALLYSRELDHFLDNPKFGMDEARELAIHAVDLYRRLGILAVPMWTSSQRDEDHPFPIRAHFIIRNDNHDQWLKGRARFAHLQSREELITLDFRIAPQSSTVLRSPVLDALAGLVRVSAYADWPFTIEKKVYFFNAQTGTNESVLGTPAYSRLAYSILKPGLVATQHRPLLLLPVIGRSDCYPWESHWTAHLDPLAVPHYEAQWQDSPRANIATILITSTSALYKAYGEDGASQIRACLPAICNQPDVAGTVIDIDELLIEPEGLESHLPASSTSSESPAVQPTAGIISALALSAHENERDNQLLTSETGHALRDSFFPNLRNICLIGDHLVIPLSWELLSLPQHIGVSRLIPDGDPWKDPWRVIPAFDNASAAALPPHTFDLLPSLSKFDREYSVLQIASPARIHTFARSYDGQDSSLIDWAEGETWGDLPSQPESPVPTGSAASHTGLVALFAAVAGAKFLQRRKRSYGTIALFRDFWRLLRKMVTRRPRRN